MDFNTTKISLTEGYEVSTQYQSTDNNYYVTLKKTIKNGNISISLSANSFDNMVDVPFFTISDVIWFDNVYYICPGDYGNYHMIKYDKEKYEILKHNNKVTGNWTLQCNYFTGSKTLNSQNIIAKEIVVQYTGANRVYTYDLMNKQYQSNSFNSYSKVCFFNVGMNKGCDNDNMGYCGYEIGLKDSSLKGSQIYFAIADNGEVKGGKTQGTDKSIANNTQNSIDCSISYNDNAHIITILSFSNSSVVPPSAFRTNDLPYTGDGTISLDSSYEKKLNMPCEGVVKNMVFLSNPSFYKFQIECEGTLFWGIGDLEKNKVIYLSQEKVQKIDSFDKDSSSLIVLKDNIYYQICPFSIVDQKCVECSVYTFINYNKQNQCVTSCSGNNMIVVDNYYCQCKEGYILDSSDNCIPFCYELCSSCTSKGNSSNNECTSCIEGYFLEEDTRNCVEECNISYYKSDSICAPCYNNCKTCKGSYNISDINDVHMNCSSCLEGYVKFMDNCFKVKNWESMELEMPNNSTSSCHGLNSSYYIQKSSSECTETLPKNSLLLNAQTGLFELCDEKCATCESSIERCTSCWEEYFLDGESCVKECGEGKVEKERKCVTCKSLGLYLYSGTCIDKCPSEYSPNNENECVLKEKICINGQMKNGICECYEGYKGKTCNIKEDNKEVIGKNKILIYIAKNENLLIQKDTIFSLKTLSDSSLINLEIPEKANYIWEIYEKYSKTRISDEFFLNGKNQRNLKVKRGAFHDNLYYNSYNKTYIAICYINSVEIGNLETQLEFSVVNFVDLNKLKVNFEAEQPFYSLNSTLKISLDMEVKEHNYSYYYQIYYKDIYNDILPLTTEFSLINEYKLKIPYTESIIIYVKDIIGNIGHVEKSLGFKVKVRSSFSNLKDISFNESMKKEEKLQQISNYLLDEDKKASNEDIKNGINTINKMIANNNDTVEFDRKMLSAINQITSYETSEKDTTTESSNLLDVTYLLGNIVSKINNNSIENNNDDDKNDNDNSQILTEIFRNADSILGKSLKIIADNKTINNNLDSNDINNTIDDNNTNTNIAQAIENTKMLIDTSNLLYTNELVEGESIYIQAENYENFIIKPGKDKNTIAITDDNDNDNDNVNKNNYNNINKYEPQSLGNNEDKNNGVNKGKIRLLTIKDKPELSKKSEIDDDPCLENQSTNIFCMNQKEIIRAQNELSLTYNLVQNKFQKTRNLNENEEKDKFKAANISLGILKSNKALQYKSLGYNPITEDTILTNIYANFYESNEKKPVKSSYNRLRTLLEESNEGEDMKIVNPSTSSSNIETFLRFTVSLSVRDKEKTRELAPNSTCLSFKSLKRASSQCKTLFDYKKNRVVCKCSGSGDFSAVYDYALSNLYKLIQYPTLSWDIINPFVICFISSSLLIIFVFSTILLIIDWREDVRKGKLTLQEKFVENYIEDHSIGTANLLTLGWLCTSFSYPYLSVFYLYAYNQPRFFRLLIQMFSVLVSMVFSSLPYYHVSEFKYRTEFVDERDIEKESWDVNNLPTRFLDWLASLVYSVIASMCVSLVVKIFTYFLRFKQLLNKTWSDKLNLLKKYISYRQLNKLRRKNARQKLNQFFQNLLAYHYITGGKKTLSNYNKKDNEGLINSSSSVTYISKNASPCLHSGELAEIREVSFNATESEPFISMREEAELRKIRKMFGRERSSKFMRVRESSVRVEERNESNNNEKERNDYGSDWNSMSMNDMNDEKDQGNRLRSDSNNSRNNLMSGINNDNLNSSREVLLSSNLEEMKNINQLNKEDINNIKEKVSIKQTQKNQLISSKTKFKKEYLHLKKGGKHILTILGNDIDNFLDFFSENESDQKWKEIKQMCLTVIFTLILLLLFAIIYYYIANIFTYLYNTYNFYIVKAWLFPTLLNITIIRLFTSYGKNIGYLIVIFVMNKYKNKNFILKFAFKYLIPKYMVSIYEIRELMQEYQVPLKNEFLKISK